MDRLLQSGTIIGGSYRVESLLGRGGMGEVWAARHLRLATKRVAIKVLRTHGEGLSGDALARFQKEAEIVSRLEHPHIVNIYDYNLTPSGYPFMVMEFLEGESLGARLKKGPLSLAETRMVLRQICSALDITHRKGILHRDLKPDNIFLVTKGTELWVKVLDFGISKILGSDSQLTQDLTVIGSPRYVSPEQALAQNRQLTPQSDVFSLGSVSYEMLLGKPAFEGEIASQVLHHVAYEPHKPLAALLPHLPLGPLNAIDTALEKQPEKRHASAMAFAAAFDNDEWKAAVVSGERKSPGSLLETVSLRPPPLKPQKSQPWLLVFLVGVFAVTVVGGAFAYRQYGLPDWETLTDKRKNTLGPGGLVLKPGETVAGPGENIAGPGGNITGPGENIAGPGGNITGPGENIAGPGRNITGPGENIAGPGRNITGPGENVAGPGGNITGPGENVAGPEGNTLKPGGNMPKPGGNMAAGPGGPKKGSRTPSLSPPAEETLSAEERRILAPAENALKAKQYADAELLARRSLSSLGENGAGSVRVNAIVAEVACAQKDLAKLNPAFDSLPASAKPSVKAKCKRLWPEAF